MSITHLYFDYICIVFSINLDPLSIFLILFHVHINPPCSLKVFQYCTPRNDSLNRVVAHGVLFCLMKKGRNWLVIHMVKVLVH
jgi:hypothetical protein